MKKLPRQTRTGEVARGLGALAVLILLLAGLPAALAVVGGSPLPHGMPTWAQISAILTRPDTSNTLFLAAVKVIGWAAWSLFTLATFLEAAGYVRGRPARRLPTPIRPMQHLARDLVAMAALVITTGAPVTGPTTAALTHQTAAAATSAIPPATAHVAAHVPSPTGLHESVRPATHATSAPGTRPWKTRIIKRGDTLWAIARHEYGSGSKYLRIFNASKHLHQPHGLPRLTDPAQIRPGQHLKIPDTGHTGLSGRGRTQPPGHTRHPATTRSAPASPPPGRSAATAPAQPATRGPAPAQRATASPPAASAAPPTATTPPPAGRPGPASQPSTGHAPAMPTRPAATPPNPTVPPHAPGPAPSGPSRPEDGSHGAPVAVRLPSGAYVGLGLAGAISIALAATRLHRRRRRPAVEEWPNPDSTDPLPPPPAPVGRARKAHLDSLTTHGRPVPSDADLVACDLTTPPPGRLTIGIQEGRPLTVPLAGLNLALSGPAGLDAGRAIMTELLAKSHRYRAEIIIPAPDADALFAGTGIDPHQLATAIDGLVITASLTAAITHLEAEVIHRARLMEATDQPDVPALRAADPAEPLPAIVLITTAPQPGEALQAILQLGRPYCIGGLLLGDWPAGTTLTLADDGTITNSHGPQTRAWTGARLFHLTATDAGAMLQVIQTATGVPESDTPAPATTAPPQSTHDSVSGPARTPQVVRDEPTGHVPPRPDTAAVGETAARPVQLRLLGAVRIEAGGEPVATGLRRIARDLLAYLALHPDGITRDQGIDALMPDRDPETGTTMLHTAINNVRKTLRTATGLRQPMFINHTAGRYHLDPALIDVDLWRLQTALHQAQHAGNDTDRIKILQQLPDLYPGELADDLTYEWAEAEREQLRRHATDALAHLAHLLKDDQPDQALTALEHAIDHDPYAEPLYQDLMRLQAHLGRLDAVRRTYQLLTNRLADLDVEPDEATHRLQLELLRPTTDSARDVGSENE
ncbi:hypothetical protein GCM10029978_046040 [Actinoallomurus acanthiterrae]